MNLLKPLLTQNKGQDKTSRKNKETFFEVCVWIQSINTINLKRIKGEEEK